MTILRFLILINLSIFYVPLLFAQSKIERIINGQDAELGKWPWAVSLNHGEPKPGEGQHFCTASLISPKYVLTAAHCIDLGLPGDIRGKASALLNFTSFKSQNRITRKVVRAFNHPDYSLDIVNNDIAIVKLDAEVDLPLLPLANAADLQRLSGINQLKVIGWGRTSNEPYSGAALNLQELEIAKINTEQCSAYFQEELGDDSIFNPTTMLCAGNSNSSGICNGDSGGPLMISDGESYYQVGISSWSLARDGCGSKNYDVFARVVNFLEWIDLVLNYVDPYMDLLLPLIRTNKSLLQTIKKEDIAHKQIQADFRSLATRLGIVRNFFKANLEKLEKGSNKITRKNIREYSHHLKLARNSYSLGDKQGATQYLVRGQRLLTRVLYRPN